MHRDEKGIPAGRLFTLIIALTFFALAVLFSISKVGAQEVSGQSVPPATATPAPQSTPAPTPEATPEPTPEATPDPTLEATPEPTPEATPDPTPEATPDPASGSSSASSSEIDLVPSFSLAISGLSFPEGKDAGETTLPEADGGDGTLTYSLTPALPAGLSFDSSTRVISGTPTAAGEFSMTYTATDEDGDEAFFNFTITVQAAPVTAKQVQIPKPQNLSVTRKQLSGVSAPALDVTWDAPNPADSLDNYQVRHKKKGATNWTTTTSPKSTRTASLTNLEAGATYVVGVRGVYFEGGQYFSDWVSTEATANTPPTALAHSITNTTLEDIDGLSFPLGITDSEGNSKDIFSDPNGDTLTYTVTSTYPGLISARVLAPVIEGTWTNISLTAHNPGESKITYGACDGYGGCLTFDRIFTVRWNLTESAHENVTPQALTISKRGTPYGDETLTYTLTDGPSDDATSAFVIDSSTGQISLKQGTTLDYETKSSYTGQIHWSVQGRTSVAYLTINVTDAKPGKPPAPTFTRTQFSEQSNPALDAAWAEPTADAGAPITAYRANYRKKGVSVWTVWTHISDPSNRTFNMPNLETGAVYEARIQAISQNEGDSEWSDIGEGTANTPPNATTVSFSAGTFPVGTIVTWSETGDGGLGVIFGDADSDTLTYSAAAQHPALLGVSLTGTAGEAVLTATLLNQGSSKIYYTASDSYGGSFTRTATIGITAKAVRSIAENSAGGTNVGAPVTGTPYDDGDDQTDDSLTYTLSGNAADSNKFVIDSATGQISVKQGATLDYETDDTHREIEYWPPNSGKVFNKFYRGKVNYTVDGHDSAIEVLLVLTDVEAGKPAAPSLARTTFSEPTNPALDVTWTAPAANGLTITGYNVQYRKKVADGETPNAWTVYTYTDANDVETSTLSASTLTVNLPDLEAGATYEVQVRAVTSEEAEGPWSDIGEGTANTPPNTTGSRINDYSFAWGSSSSPVNVSQFFADGDGDTLTYSASSEYPGVIQIWLTDPDVLTMKAVNPSSSTVTYGAHDSYGGYVHRTLTATGIADETRDVAENSPAGTHVGRNLGGTPYNNVALTHTMTGEVATSGLFVLDASTGQLSVATGAVLDYETKSSYTGQVHFTVQEQAALINLTVKVTDVEAAMSAAPTLTRTQFSEPTAPALDVAWTAAAANGLTITGYNVQYRKKVADGETENAWTEYTYTDSNNVETSTLSASTLTVNLPDLTAGATYEARVRAVTSEEGEGPWSDIGEGTANRPPAASSVSFGGGTLGMGGSFAWHEQAPLGSGAFFTDPDGDTLTYSASAQHPALLGVSVTGTSGSAVLTANLLNQGASKVNYVASDPYGGQVTRSANITITAKTARSVAENSAAGTAVGSPVTGTPYNNVALTYSLTGNAADSNKFVIDSSTGQISVKQGATLDYETDNTYRETETWNGQVIAKFYRGKVNYTVNGHNSAIDLLIEVTDMETGKTGTPTLTRTEFSEPTNPALDVTWAAPATDGLTITGYNVQYRKKVADGETENAWTEYTYTDSNNVETSTLSASTLTVNLPDLTAGATYEARVRAVTSEEGEGPWSDIGEGTANRPPAASSVSFGGGTLGMGGSFAWHEQAPLGSGAFFTDADGDTLTYSASAQHPALLGVSLTGTAGSAVLTANLLNQGASKANYIASDPYGGQVTRSATITITAKTSRSIAENSAAGTAVGSPVTGTPYDDGDDQTNDALTYSLTGKANDSGKFVIDSSTGQISVATGATLDYETDNSYRETETYNSQIIGKFYRGKVNYTVNGHNSAIEVLIKVTDMETGKTGTPTVTRTQFSEPTNPALDVTWAAPATDGLTITGYKAQYRIKVADGETENAWTAYSGTLGATATSLNLPDLTAGATYELQVRVVTTEEGEGPWSDTGEGTANRPPVASSVSFLGGSLGMGGSFAWHEEAPLGSGVFFTDADGDTLTYSASAEKPALLGVGLTGTAGSAVLTANLLNQGASKVNYVASDPYGGSVTRSANITITAKTSRSIAENSAGGTNVGAPVTGTPYDDGDDQTDDALSYSLTGKANESGKFVIDSATGQISVATGATLDYETDNTHRETETYNGQVIAKFYRGKVNYTVNGHNSVIDVIIKITDVEAGKPGAPTVTRTRFSVPTDPALDVAWTAPAANGATITGYNAQYRIKVADGETANAWTLYEYEDPDNPGSQISLLAATPTTVKLPDLTAGATYEVQVAP